MLYKHFTYFSAEIAIWEATESVSELWDILKNKDFYLSGFQKLKTEKRQKEWIAARILVEMFCNNKTIAYDENGKPFLTGNSFKISISHTANYVALIAHPTCEVGIDIEGFGKKILRVKERFLIPEELQHIDNENEKHLLLHWCAKETIYKMENKNVDFREHIRVLPFVQQQKGTFSCQSGLRRFDFAHRPLHSATEYCSVSEVEPQSPEIDTLSYSVEKDFVMTWAVK